MKPEHRLSATKLARKLGDALPPASLREAVAVWRGAGEPDPDFADALDRVAEADRPSRTRRDR